MRFLPLLFSFAFFPTVALAQFSFIKGTSIPVVHNGVSLTNAWAGGINAAQLSKIDLDQDGLDDIFIFDRTGNKFLTFLANETPEGLNYSYTHLYDPAFPEMHNWALLRDFNCDGKADIFTYNFFTGGSFRVYKNTSSNGELSFELESPLVQSFFEFGSTQYTANIYTSSQDIPAIFDYEGDGDLDVISFSINGVTTQLHLNQSIENYGVCDSLDFVLRNMCYGQFAEGSESNSIELDYECPFNVVNPKDNFRHAGSTVLAFDATQDGLPELILGDITFPNLTCLINSDHNGIDSISSFSTDFPNYFGASEEVEIDVFPAAFYEDIDGDGIRDLIACTNNATTSINTNSVWYYQNNGADNAPVFELVQKDFLQNTMIDVGEGSFAFAFDYDGDGLQDLFITNRGYYISNGNYLHTISRYRNTGTQNQPEFHLEEENFLNVSQSDLDLAVHPTVGDINGDGLADWIIGDASGSVYFLPNTGSAGSSANFNMADLQPLTANGEIIDVGQYSSPQLFDLDMDGLPDLIVGERNGNINYFRNTGSADNFQLELITDSLGKVNTTDETTLIGSSNPQFFRQDGTTYLFSGNEAGNIQLYTNIDGNLDGSFLLANAAVEGIDEGQRSQISIVDINQNGLPDLFVGNQRGGISFFSGIPYTGISAPASQNQLLKVYPNPATAEITVKLANPEAFSGAGIATIYSVSGSVVYKSSISGSVFSVDISRLPSGIYHLTVASGAKIQGATFIKK